LSAGGWRKVGNAKVFYARSGYQAVKVARRIAVEDTPDAWYLNSVFSYPYSIQPLLLRKTGWLAKSPIILAPRGELAPSALATGRRKKLLAIRLLRLLGLWDQVARWQASGPLEAAMVKEMLP